LQGLFFKDTNSLPPKLMPLKPYLNKIKEIANIYCLSIEELAIAYILMQEQIDEVIIGVENTEQLSENIFLFNNKYPTSILEEINALNIKENELLYPKNWN
jgi:aryl-alcohol dehydrogenase-like predicted oxidoreductase